MNFGPRKIEMSSEASPAIRISPIRRARSASSASGDALEPDAARCLHQHHVARLDQARDQCRGLRGIGGAAHVARRGRPA